MMDLILAQAVPGTVSVDTTTVGQILLFLGMIISTLVTLYTQARNHRWDKEDRESIKTELRHRMETETKGREQIARDLLVNTEITKNAFKQADSAYKEANHVNKKIERLSEMFNVVVATRGTAPLSAPVVAQSPAQSATIESIKKTGEETKDVTKGIDIKVDQIRHKKG